LYRWAVGCVIAIAIGGMFSGARAATPPANWVAATSATFTPHVTAFANVQGGSPIIITAPQPGIVTGLTLLPGASVTANEEVAHLDGPQISAAEVQTEAALSAAQSAQRAAQFSLLAEQQKVQQHLSTNQLVAQARGALAAADAQTAIAQANVKMFQETITLHSPMAGVVQSVTVTNGDLLAADQAVLIVQPFSATWLKAVFYGSDANLVLPGTTGIFLPDGGGNPVKLIARGALGVSQAGGGMPVALAATGTGVLTPGLSGTVTLNLPPQTVTIVPSDALILDQGKWWLMLHDATGDHPAVVVPGPAEGFNTVIKSGLTPGEDVIVTNAYLLYHRGIAALYQPPD
jgi:membrane fusion protein, heavy metal efflux system